MSGGIAFFMGTSRALTTHESRVTNKIPPFLIVADILCVMIQLFGKIRVQYKGGRSCVLYIASFLLCSQLHLDGGCWVA